MAEPMREGMQDPTTRDAVIDPATFAALAEMAGADFVDELVDTFLEEAPPMLADLRRAAASHDPDRFRRAAHSLKSNAMTFGASSLGSMAKALELRGIDDATPTALDALEAEYARTVDALRTLRHG